MKRWARRALPGLLAMALEAMWLGAWLRWVAAAGLPGTRSPGLLPLLSLAGLSYLLVRILLELEIEIDLARGISLLLALVALFVSARVTLYPWALVPPLDPSWLVRFGADLRSGFARPNAASLLLITLVWLWWRGSRMAALPRLNMRRARRLCGAAIGWLGFLALVVAVTRPIDMSPWILGATVLGLSLLATTRLELASEGFGATPIELGPRWLFILLVTISLLVGVALTLGSMVSPDLARQVAAALEPLPRVLLRLATFIIVLFVMLWSRLAQAVALFLARLFGLRGDWENPLQEPGARALPENADERLAVAEQIPLWLTNALQILILVIVVWLVARLLSRAMQRYLTPRGEGGEASFEADGLAGRMKEDALLLLKRAGASLAEGLRGLVPRRDGVRGLYARMLALMAERERPRRASETPYEFLPGPQAELPAASEELEELTRAYVEARYGEREPEASRLDMLRAAWRRIRRAAETASGG